jgi:hypothetical protein
MGDAVIIELDGRIEPPRFGSGNQGFAGTGRFRLTGGAGARAGVSDEVSMNDQR